VRATKTKPCPAEACQSGRPLITLSRAAEVAAIFKVLSNDTRLRLLHALVRAGELSVTGLAGAVGMSPQAVSNQLQRLTDRGILAHRRQGTSVYYRVVNPCVTDLLDRGLCLVEGSCPEP
jgi:ArsR family transcriptional regulator, lead/cadmium/zinc/bismuth-responsive transcriptional repressor